MEIIMRAVLAGMAVVLAGTIPRNLIFLANLRYYPSVPWAVPLTAVYLWFFWKFLKRDPASLRATRVSRALWIRALVAGVLGIVALVLALQVANRLIALPPQQLPDFSKVPRLTILSLLLMAAPVAGLVEEAAFRGYMQAPIERRYGLTVAILITGTMFAVAHLDFTWILWPYYVAVGAIYGAVTYYTQSILPAVVLHTAGNLYSNFDLWLHGQAEWQAPARASALIWKSGADAAFWMSSLELLVVAVAMAWAYFELARAARTRPLGLTAVRNGSSPARENRTM